MSAVIRSLEKRDRPALEAVLRSDTTFREDEIGVALELIDDALASDSSDYRVRVAVTGDDVVAGYICFGPTPMTACTYDLYWIVIHSSWRGRGIASRLVQSMENELRDRGGGQVRVETSESEGYGAARRLYASLGYPELARFSDFYREGDALIVFYKKL